MEDLKQRGNTAFAQGDYLGAVASFSQALNIDPDVIALYSNRSAAYLKLGRVEESLEDAEACISMDAAWPKGYGRKAAALQFRGDLALAMEVYRDAAEKDDTPKSKAEYAKSQEDLRLLIVENGSSPYRYQVPQNVKKLATKSIKLTKAKQQQGSLLFNRGIEESGLGDREKCINYFREAARLGSVGAMNGLAAMLKIGGEDGLSSHPKEKEELLQLASEMGHARAACNLAATFEEANDLNSAMCWYKRSLEQGYPNGAFHLGRCFLQMSHSAAYPPALPTPTSSTSKRPSAPPRIIAAASENTIKALAITGLHWLHVAVEDMQLTQIEEALGMACALLCECYQLGIGAPVDEPRAAEYRKQAYIVGAMEKGAVPGAFVTIENTDWDVPGGVILKRLGVAESGEIIELPSEGEAMVPALDPAEAASQLGLYRTSINAGDKDRCLQEAARQGSATADFILGDRIWNKHNESYLKCLEVGDGAKPGPKQEKAAAAGLLVMTRSLQHLRRALIRGWEGDEAEMTLSASQRIGLFHKNYYPQLTERSFERKDHEAWALVFLGRASMLGCEMSSLNLADMLEARGDIAGALQLYRQCHNEPLATKRIAILESRGGTRTERLLASLSDERREGGVLALPDRTGDAVGEQALRSCAFPTCATTGVKKLLVCCQEAHYCSASCQKSHWKEHKKLCPRNKKNINNVD